MLLSADGNSAGSKTLKGQRSNVFLRSEIECLLRNRHQSVIQDICMISQHERMKCYLLKISHKTVCVTAGRGPGAGRRGRKGHPKGVFSGGEIQRLRRLGHEAHTPNVLVGVSD